MPNLTNEFYSLTNNIKTNHYIETGTYLGNGIKDVLNNYEIYYNKLFQNFDFKEIENNLANLSKPLLDMIVK